MKSKTPLIACLLILAFFLQANHTILATFSLHHKNTANNSACRILCIVEQTNKTVRYAAAPSTSVLAKRFNVTQNIIDSSASLASFSPHSSPPFHDWISTIVQRK